MIVGLVIFTAAGCEPARTSGETSASPVPPEPPPSYSSAEPTGAPSPTPSPTPRTSTSDGARPVAHAFPVIGTASYSRDHHDYPATDVIAPCGATSVAAATGRVLEVNRVDSYNPAVNAGATRGGLSVSILGDDGVRYYGSHFESINSGIAAGVRVTAGQPIAKVGRTGDASACHVHFGISPPCATVGDWWIRRGVIWPWRYLDSWRSRGNASPVAEVGAWRAKYGCPARPLTDP